MHEFFGTRSLLSFGLQQAKEERPSVTRCLCKSSLYVNENSLQRVKLEEWTMGLQKRNALKLGINAAAANVVDLDRWFSNGGTRA